MKIVETSGGLLTNSEVVAVLADHEADRQPLVSKAHPSEIAVYESLVKVTPNPNSREEVEAFVEDVKEYNFGALDLLHLINHRPTTFPVLYQCIADIEGRFDADQQQAILGIVAKHLLK